MYSVELDRATKRNFGYDVTAALASGLFSALVVNFLPAIARREGASPLLLAALAASPFAARSLAIFCGMCLPQERHAAYVSRLLTAGRALFLGAVFLSAPGALLMMGIGLWVSMAFVEPAQVEVLRRMYPARLRARLLGYSRIAQAAAGALAAPIAGRLMDLIGQGTLLGAGALVGVAGAVAYGHIRVPECRSEASQRFTPLASFALLRDHPRYRRIVVAWVIWGAGTFMAAPLYPLVQIDRFQASYADVGTLSLASAVAGLVGYLVLGPFIDRRGATGTVVAGFLLAGLAPLVYAVAPSFPLLILASVCTAVGTSAFDIGWQTAQMSQIADEHRPRFIAAHASLTGVRGTIVPFVGSLLASTALGLTGTLIAAGGLALVGATLMAHALGARTTLATLWWPRGVADRLLEARSRSRTT